MTIYRFTEAQLEIALRQAVTQFWVLTRSPDQVQVPDDELRRVIDGMFAVLHHDRKTGQYGLQLPEE